MIHAEELARQLKSVQDTLIESISGLSQEQAAQRPGEGCWSVLDCVEHLYLVERGIVRLLTKPPEQAIEGENQVFGQERMHQAMLNRTRKITAPDAFVPTGRFATLNEAESALSGLRTNLIEALGNDQVVFDGFTFPHPVLGPLTRLDWINFTISHAQRHQQQLEEIKEKTGAKATAIN